jgi:hypothetical protein
VNLLVTELCFTKYLRLECELHELLRPAPLHHNLRAIFIHCERQFILLREVQCVRSLGEFPTPFLEQVAELFRLVARDWTGMQGLLS